MKGLGFLEDNKKRWLAMLLLDVVFIAVVFYLFNNLELSASQINFALFFICLIPIKYIIDYFAVVKKSRKV